MTVDRARQVEDDRVAGAERLLEHRVERDDDPALAEVVVHDEHAARLEALADVGERLCREQVALEPDVAVAAVQHQRIDQRVDDQVVLLRWSSCRKLRPSSRCTVDARIRVGLVGMIAPAEPLDHRIDLDGIDARGAPLQRAADVVAGAGADDEHLARTAAARRRG